jgi:hypothetical protein
LNQQTKNRLERHRTDYAQTTGHPFKHFFCPILFDDVATKLIRGHIINEAFRGSSLAWVIQRADVDSFFGAYFEGDFELSQYLKKSQPWDHFSDKKLFSNVRPRISFRGNEIQYFLWRPKQPDEVPPRGFAVVELKHLDKSVDICVQDGGREMMANVGHWNVVTQKNLRLPAFVSILKAAHLSMFAMLGYRYALSDAGRFIGEDILGRFFRLARHLKTKKQAQEDALAFFRQYQHIIQYSIPSTTILAGTLSDGYVNLCATAEGRLWGMIMFVKIQEYLMAALLPYPDDPEAFALYLDFLKNDHEQIHVMVGQFDTTKNQWTVSPERHGALWSKGLDSYPHTLA